MTVLHAKRLLAVSLTMAMAMAMLSGCATGGGLVQTPTVDLTSVEVTDASFTRQTFLLHFKAANPNGFPLPIKAVRYTIRLNDEKFAGGETHSDFTIPAGGESTFAISVELDLLKSGAQLTSIVRAGVQPDVDYELAGKLTIDVPTAPSVSFSNSGTIMVRTDLLP